MINEDNFKKNSNKKFKLCRNKRFVASVIAVSTLLGVGSVIHIRRSNDKVNSNSDYVVGYDNIGLFNGITKRVTDSNFVLLDVGNHKYHSLFLEKKLEYCKENGIDIGICLSSDAVYLSDIYLDLEYVMGIMERYDINYPLYLKVDGILNNEKITLEEGSSLILAFLEKADANHIYVGVTGSYNNMLPEFSEYDCLVTDSDDIYLSDSIHNKDGIYYANKSLNNVISENLYNNSNCFIEDEYHIVSNGESINGIARKYNISVYDIRKYNNKFYKNIKNGDVLRIPSMLQNFNHHLNLNGEEADVGVDVSLWQSDINWDVVDVDYAIIQVRDFENLENDPKFLTNVAGCAKNGIPMGFYVFSRAVTKEEVREEAKYLVSQLHDIDVDYPVYLDLETEFWHSIDSNGILQKAGYNKEETKMFVLNFIKTWEMEILNAGYIPGIYCNYSLYNSLNLVTDNYLDNLACWVAGGEYYDKEVIYNKNVNMPVISLEENEVIGMKQFTSMGVVDGINTSVDLNYCYVDYPISYKWTRKDFSKFKYLDSLSLVLLGSGIILAIKGIKNKGKKKVRRKDS